MGDCILQRADGTVERASFGRGPISIGRTSANQFRIRDEFVSRVHCELFLRDNQVVIRDLNSTNGTWVNGRAVQETVLSTGDKLKLGETELAFQADVRLSPPEVPGGPLRHDVSAILRVISSPPPRPAAGGPGMVVIPPQPTS